MDWIQILLICFILVLPLSGMARQASPLMLAQVYQGYENVSAYLVSEKLDGIRVYWNGEQLRTRSGYPIDAPDWFTKHLPDMPLDGELWAGRGQFSTVNSIVQSYQATDEQWRSLSLMLFDMPDETGTFEHRSEQLKKLVDGLDVSWIQALEQTFVDSELALQAMLSDVLAEGGEGLMLHRRTSHYQTGRSPHLLKVKQHQDAEATVIGFVPGKGKYQGMTGSLKVRMDDGREFRLGSGLSDALRVNPPPLGSRVTFLYNGLTTSGLPRFARFIRVRDAAL